MNGSPDPSDFWAKLKYKNDDRSTGEVVGWHPLAAHSAEVAAVTEALLERTILGERMAALVGWDALSDVHVQRLCVLAALHDAGKVNHGFQRRGHAPSAPRIGHVGPMAAFLEGVGGRELRGQIAHALTLEEMLDEGWFADFKTLKAFLRATWGHHGEPVSPRSKTFDPDLWKDGASRSPLDALEKLMQFAKQQWFPDAFERDACPFPAKEEGARLQHAFNGVLTLADWIGSDDEHFFAFADDTGTEKDPMPNAEEQAHVAINELFLDAGETRALLPAEVGFEHVLPKHEPHCIQKTVRDLPVHESGSLTVLESDTGSGKTEAAVARFFRLFQREDPALVDGMYFAVPTRSAAQQLHGRIEKIRDQVFNGVPKDDRPPVVQAVPGYIKADDAEGRTEDDEGTPLPRFEVLWPDDVPETRGWAAENPKRYLAGAIVVGTIDQVLLSTLRVNHAHMRAAALLRHFLVVDEVHASDAYMTHMLSKVLNQHVQAGGHALLMSATLGASARVRFTKAGLDPVPLPSLEEAKRTAYPLVTHVDDERKKPAKHPADSVDEPKTVEPELCDLAGAPEQIAQLALEKAQQGARVLVIRNTVADCIDMQEALEEAAGDDMRFLFGVGSESQPFAPAPHHSRYAQADRSLLDDAIEATFGKDTDRTCEAGRVAVATQTCEQSLDIDADLLLTDLCPMDVLLQRIGRLHRHPGRDRPAGFDTARCLVLVPGERDLTPAIVESGPREGAGLRGPHGLGTVYGDLRALEATWQVLDDEGLRPWRIPAASEGDASGNRTLVERATHPDRLRQIVSEADDDLWEKHQNWIIGQNLADRDAAGFAEINRDEAFGKTEFSSDLESIKTRLGRDDYRVVLPTPEKGPFGAPVRELSVTEWQVEEAPETEDASDVTPLDGGFAFTFCGHAFRYDCHGLAPEEENSSGG
jgi:CRISPR-associated endonuclease/helicase Cas3